jgi:hypothetical protein
MTARTFHLGDLLSITDGKLVSPRHMDGVYDIVDFVTGEQHFTHQLIRASGVVKTWLLNQHPWLADVDVDFDIPKGATSDEAKAIVDAWLTEAVDKHGERHPVEPMPFGMYVGREPIAELRELAPHAQIIAVNTGDDGEDT